MKCIDEKTNFLALLEPNLHYFISGLVLGILGGLVGGFGYVGLSFGFLGIVSS